MIKLIGGNLLIITRKIKFKILTIRFNSTSLDNIIWEKGRHRLDLQINSEEEFDEIRNNCSSLVDFGYTYVDKDVKRDFMWFDISSFKGLREIRTISLWARINKMEELLEFLGKLKDLGYLVTFCNTDKYTIYR